MQKQQPNWATAVFQNAAVIIECARKTTLAQLAEELSALGEIHGKLMLPVYVRAAPPSAICSGYSARD